ncbi:MAG TPA: 4-hydroxybenzoate octaprenyltransferase [Steroidobacteraceae bacterium]|nr:4-hydroxybenzoate octaprenyltransferase [Steroidobacteraceae bacterium]
MVASAERSTAHGPASAARPAAHAVGAAAGGRGAPGAGVGDMQAHAAAAASPGGGGTAGRARATLLPWLERRLRNLARLMRLDRPIGIWLLLWPTLWALWIAAGGHPRRRLLAIFLAGTVVMRSAGCVVNDLADRNIDPHVKRTRLRPLAFRVVSPFEALVLATLLGLAALALVLQLNAYTVKLSLVGAALTVSYPLLKRFFPLPQFYLGLCFGWAVPMAFAATLGTVPRIGWLMLLAAVLWAGVYDTLYAMVDRDDDLRIGVQSSAILFGDLDRLIIGAMQAMVLYTLLLIGRALHFGAGYRAGLIAGAGCFLWQQWLIRRRERNACFAAFQNNNYFGLAIFAGVLLQYAAR